MVSCPTSRDVGGKGGGVPEDRTIDEELLDRKRNYMHSPSFYKREIVEYGPGPNTVTQNTYITINNKYLCFTIFTKRYKPI